MQPIIIFGAGGHGRVVLDILLQQQQFEPVGFLDNNPDLTQRHVDGVRVLGNLSRLPELRREGVRHAVVAIGDNGIRRKIARILEQSGFELVNAIHPSAQIASTATLGRGVVIATGANICAHVQVGDYAILNSGCIVDHESMIGTATHVCPGVRLAGHVVVESGAFVGIGATVIQNVRIGMDATVGAGAVVIRDVDALTTVVGVPARVTRSAQGSQPAQDLVVGFDSRDPMALQPSKQA